MNTFNRNPKQRDLGPRRNEQIRVPSVQVIDNNGQNLGVIPTKQALDLAKEAGLDLLEINPNSETPICKIMDYGKWKYEEKKRKNENKKKTKIVETKELQFRPNIEKHDFDTKVKRAVKFLGKGDKVKVSLRFKGREFAHKEEAQKIFDNILEELGDLATLDVKPKFEGRQMMMILAPGETSKD
ncbi:MAG: translation initiation factor IF-3 [Alphaproteobacteria bacterium]|nr:translation initiation factor IF-3 [Alphaproteobacteria bacterium]